MEQNSELQRAKHPRWILAGPYGHPFHAIMITIPIGAWSAALIFDIVSLIVDEPAPFTTGALWLIGIGVVGAVLAAFFGLMDLAVIAPGTRARRTALAHMSLNLVAVVLFSASWVARFLASDGEPVVLGIVLAWASYLLVGASGYLGGELAYRYGVRVAAEQTQSNGFLPAARR